MQYDAAVVLGNRPLSISHWVLPAHVYKSLDRAAELYNQKTAAAIVLSGKWTIDFDILKIQQPFRECDAMEEYLLKNGIPGSAIYKEGDSLDTISNLYYMKRQILAPKGIKKLIFVAGESRLGRIEFLCQRILGLDYAVATEGVSQLPEEVSTHEPETMRSQSAFLQPMKDGDDTWLDGQFFTGPFYDAARERVLANPGLVTEDKHISG